MKTETDKIKSIPEYAKLIGKSRQWVYQLIKDKSILTITIGGKQFIKLN